MVRSTLAQWSHRRWVAMALAVPVLTALYVRAAGTPLGQLSGAWLALGAVAATVGAAVLATYVPAEGWHLEWGCSPCAAVAGLSLLGSLIAVSTYGAMAVGPGLAAAVSLYGLSQRLAPSAGCGLPRPEA